MGSRADYVTRPRELIASVLASEPRFLSAAEIHDELDRSGARVSLSTVYRTLDRLHEKGEVTSRPDAEGEATYMVCEPTRHHHHAICDECGRVEDVDCAAMEPVAESLRSVHGFELDGHSMDLRAMPRVPIKIASALALVGTLVACAHKSPSALRQAQGDTGIARGANRAAAKIQVATTISTLNSFVQGVGGEHVSVKNIVPIGASPETFQPAPQDVATVADADVLVENGAGLETWLAGLLRDAGKRNLHVVVCSNGLPVKNLNPHLWMDPVLAKQYVLEIRDALIAVDPSHAGDYRSNAAAYDGRLDELVGWIRKQIATIPPSHRYMIVFHNAWQYYNDRFGITTLGFVERNPGQEPNPQQIAQLIDLAKQHHVHGVFSEPEYSPKLLYSIAQGAGIKVVENLYDDSVGTDPRVANYIAMLTYDTNVIVQTLK